MKDSTTVQALQWTGQSLKLLDQRLLPATLCYHEHDSAETVAEAIMSMQVRGAPAIGIAAAYGVVLSARQNYQSGENWRQAVYADTERLAQTRPTAVNLFWALDVMRDALQQENATPETLLATAQRLHAEDIAANQRLGDLGAEVLGAARAVLTHCNAGALATGGYGTALGVVRSAFRQGTLQRVYATETRPWSQGARLTVWEMQQEHIPVTLIADSAAGYLMKTGAVEWVIVGADRIALNGDTANKIGTYALAVLARQHGVKMMVAAPSSTIDWQLPDGAAIMIEERDRCELLPECYFNQFHVSAWNPVFDVTPAALIDAIVTERGVVHQPANCGLAGLREME